MTTVDIITSILMLFAGIGVFLIACTMLSDYLEALSSDKLKQLFGKASKSKLLGVGIGAVATAAIQSSGATTVMVIGFVNAGIMSMAQAATMIFGANIGTTITAQIVALGMFGSGTLSTTVIFSSFAGLGAFFMAFSKKSFNKNIGGIIAGFGMLFVGLSMMSNSMDQFAALQGVKDFLASIDNVFLLVLFGALFTAIIQSSSVMTSIAIAMVFTGLLSLDQGIFLTMGSNIGSCVVAIIAGFTSSRNAKRTALMHLIFNCFGVIVFMCINFLIELFTGGGYSFGIIFETLFPKVPQIQLAMFHTFFNCCTVIIILPMTEILVRIVERILPDTGETSDEEGNHLYFVNEMMLQTQPIAVGQTKKEILNMAQLAMDNYLLSLDAVCTLNTSRSEEFSKRERELNFLNREITRFVTRLSETTLNENDHVYLTTTFHTVSDLERIGDYSENIMEYADYLRELGEKFSPEALEEIGEMREQIEKLYAMVITTYTTAEKHYIDDCYVFENRIDELTDQMENGHIRRLKEGTCSPSLGAQYISLAQNSERIADHLINMANAVKDFGH